MDHGGEAEKGDVCSPSAFLAASVYSKALFGTKRSRRQKPEDTANHVSAASVSRVNCRARGGNGKAEEEEEEAGGGKCRKTVASDDHTLNGGLIWTEKHASAARDFPAHQSVCTCNLFAPSSCGSVGRSARASFIIQEHASRMDE